MAREPDQTTDTENTDAGNPNMAVQRDAKPQRVVTGSKWRPDDDISDNSQAQKRLGG